MLIEPNIFIILGESGIELAFFLSSKAEFYLYWDKSSIFWIKQLLCHQHKVFLSYTSFIHALLINEFDLTAHYNKQYSQIIITFMFFLKFISGLSN